MTEHPVVEFMGLTFSSLPRNRVIGFLLEAIHDRPYRYLVTPNVDHVVNYVSGKIPLEVYDQASVKLCDSRVLRLLAKLKGRHLVLYPGSDLVKDLVSSDLTDTMRIAIVGPTIEQFDELRLRYPRKDFSLVPAPFGLVAGSPAWKTLVDQASVAEWDILLVCLSFPKQEILCHDIGTGGRRHGLALCVGASVDFLTGAQRRAPYLVQLFALEWLYRLIMNPRRLWRRYLLTGPQIFVYFLKHELQRRL
ncbi:WecB/TagA/CpsF family glycosyltransferase [Rhizobium sp. RU36D]|uniref:WecB/TagA/CpsF family glycosyltransferase n=1 Tax=Rhizobium sp. RU36D TaxID=1907415 RepID=UPI0009D7A1BE|nr:WecB/TagA/CpsF family glycosyltransferase [Rhizobium sp. RU36D]SMD20160.1 polymer biosynthesis protein, WecB/TagA/CpsF family [Rhizobium sp. RU36D]